MDRQRAAGGEQERASRDSVPPGMREAIRAYRMIGRGMKVVVGVSGGADSVCLLAGLVSLREELGISLVAVHVEHGIRGEESLADAGYVAELCERWNVKLSVERIDVEAVARERGLTVEEAGRTVRYEVFARIAREQSADRIAVAHNRNDQAETVLWNLARGSGVKGLGGIRPMRGRIIRPLLFTERSEIESYLRVQGIRWRTDRTNLETAYTRNRIRLELLPWLTERLNAQAVDHIAQAAQRLWEVQDYLEAQTAQAAQRSVFAGSWETGIVPVGQVVEKPVAALPEDHATEGTEGDVVETTAGYATKQVECQAVRMAERHREEEVKGQALKMAESHTTKTENRGRDSFFLYLPEYRRESPLIQKELLKYCLRLAGGGSGLKDVGSVHLESLQALCEQPCGKACSLPGRMTAVREGEYVRFTSNRTVPGRGDESLGLRDPNGRPRVSADQPGGCQERTGEPDRHRERVRQSDGYQERTSEQDRRRERVRQPDGCQERIGEQDRRRGRVSQPDRRQERVGQQDARFEVQKRPDRYPAAGQQPWQQDNPEFPVDTERARKIGRFTAYAAILPNSPDIMSEIRQEKKYTKWLSYDTIYSNVCFRKRRAGDYLVVNADGGRKKLKDYLIEQKIPRAMRDSLWLLADGSHILWVVGWRISEAAKVTWNTQKILKIRLEEDMR